jgi:O-antigen/teichoic acid export membrane protein
MATTDTSLDTGLEPEDIVAPASPVVDVLDETVEDIDVDGSLRADAAGGFKWGMITSIATQVGRLGFSVVLMRLLGPESYGIVGQATVYMMITGIFANLGLAAALIQRPRLNKADVGTALWMNLGLGSVLAVATVVAAPFLAGFFRTDELATVLRILSLSIVLRAVAVVPTAILTRKLQLKSVGVAEISATVVSGVAGVIAAANGAGYWALVIQMLVLDSLCLLMLLRKAGWPSLAWSTSSARGLWSFSSRLLGADLVNFISDNSDKLLVARYLGPTPLALYSLAHRALVFPLVTMGKSADRVIFPVISRLQHDRARVARVFLEASQGVSLAVAPLMVTAILAAPLGVPLVFGEAWAPAVVPFQLLAAHAIFFLLVLLTNPVVWAAGRTNWEFWWSIFTTVVAFVTFAIGLQWGITGVAAGFLVLGFLLNPIRFVMVQRLIPVTVRGYGRAIAPAATSCVVLAGVWLVTARLLGTHVADLGVLTGASLTAGVAYVAALRVFWPGDFHRQVEFARLVVKQRSA